jgi:hypothetical protein
MSVSWSGHSMLSSELHSSALSVKRALPSLKCKVEVLERYQGDDSRMDVV